MKSRFAIVALALIVSAVSESPTIAAKPPQTKLWEWGKGIAVESQAQKGMTVYFWFYEWNMFEARKRGEHTGGTHELPRKFSDDGSRAVITAPDMKLSAKAVADGAELELEITNRSKHAWPDIAAGAGKAVPQGEAQPTIRQRENLVPRQERPRTTDQARDPFRFRTATATRQALTRWQVRLLVQVADLTQERAWRTLAA